MGDGRHGRVVRRIRAQVRATMRTCYRCGQPIDWTLPHLDPDTGTVNRDSGTIEHKQPRSKYPELAEDPGNIAASHWQCNLTASDHGGRPALGLRSRAW